LFYQQKVHIITYLNQLKSLKYLSNSVFLIMDLIKDTFFKYHSKLSLLTYPNFKLIYEYNLLIILIAHT